MSASTRIWSRIDFEREGKQSDWLHLPISSDVSAYGWVPIPIVCIKNGQGPTAVLFAGTHGDEYEGQIALLELARTMEPAEIRGRVIIVPALNFPAVEAGRRVSPLDEGNLNRLYPGKPHGTATEMIAHYVTQMLLPMADLAVDLHSGGRSLDHFPCAYITPSEDPERHALLLDLMRVFGAPVGIINDGKGGGGKTTLPAAAEQMGIPVFSAELGSGATLDVEGKELARAGVRRLLKHVGIRDDDAVPSPQKTRIMEAPGWDYYIYAEANGLFEPAARLGQEVKAGQHAGYIHSIERPTDPPVPLTFAASGLVVWRRFPTHTTRGDGLFGLMRDAE